MARFLDWNNYLMLIKLFIRYLFYYSSTLNQWFSEGLRCNPICNKDEVTGRRFIGEIEDKHKNYNIFSYNFGSYLAGLFEGDGHIWIPKENMLKKHNPRFCITFHIKDLPLAKVILKKIGYGFIRIKSKNNAVVLTVSPIKGLKFILSEINAYLRTPKIHQVNKLIIWLNKHHGTNYLQITCNDNSLSNDSWLAGFVDADGSFYIYYLNKFDSSPSALQTGMNHPPVAKPRGDDSKKVIIKLNFTIEQRKIDSISGDSYEPIMRKIADFLKTNLNTRKQVITGNSYFRVVVSSKISRCIIIDYLTKYCLFSSKYLNYIDWKKASLMKIKTPRLTDEDNNYILSLKNNMNNKRIEFNWDHLY